MGEAEAKGLSQPPFEPSKGALRLTAAYPGLPMSRFGFGGVRGGSVVVFPPVDKSGKSWCRLGELNPGPTDYESVALPLS